MVLSSRRVGWRPSPRVGPKFFLTISVLVPAVLAIAAVGAAGLQRMAASTDVIHNRNFVESEHAADVVSAAFAIHEAAMYQVAAHDRLLLGQLSDKIDTDLIPQVQAAITVLRTDYVDEPAGQALVDRMAAGLRTYEQLRRSGVYAEKRPVTEAALTALARRTYGILEPIVTAGEELRARESLEAAQSKRESDATYRSSRQLLAASVLVVLLLGVAVVLALIRNMVPRIRRYSRFAEDVAAGRPTTALLPRGRDEIAELGVALDDMVLQRELATAALQAEHDLAEWAAQAQAEFVETLQVTRSEDEAQVLLQRHLERSIPDTSIAVLRRNNSANRLQAATTLPPSSGLAARLVGAEPRACIALRLGRIHREGIGRTPLLQCTLCGDGDRPATCEPLLVGGEIIGSVLVGHSSALTDAEETQIKGAVGQAAPILANLRSLALAEFRANSDSLTGLPNKRATEDTLKRMVAQAGRSASPLTAVMLDLDHFKEINDRFGHTQGDEVLAAVGTAIDASLRANDFAGRFGGEEFLILLPDTTIDGAWQVAEKIRIAIAAIRVAGVDREITASLGIAGLLEHAGNAAALLRQADRAQYSAKAAGRNCTVVAEDIASSDPSRTPASGHVPVVGDIPPPRGSDPDGAHAVLVASHPRDSKVAARADGHSTRG